MKEIVSFFLSGKIYGVEVSHMQGIEKCRDLSQPVDMPDFLQGVVDIRGEIIPVIPIKKRLVLPMTELTRKSKIFVFRTDHGKIACIVDGLSKMLKIDEQNERQFPPIIQNGETGYVDFVARSEGELILAIDPNRILDEGEWKLVQGMLDRIAEEKRKEEEEKRRAEEEARKAAEEKKRAEEEAEEKKQEDAEEKKQEEEREEKDD